MRCPLVGLAACAAVFLAWPGPPAARAGDGVAVEMRVEGTIPKPDSPVFDKNLYAKDRVVYAWQPHQFPEGELYVEVVQGKERAVVVMSLGGDKTLKEQADKLVGKRVVVECRGEYKLTRGKLTVPASFGTAEQEVVFAALKLTVVKMRPAD